jgi:glucokinase
MKPETTYAIGIDLGGTNIKAVVVDATGRVLSQEEHPTNDIPDSTGGSRVAPWAERIGQHIEAIESHYRVQAKWIGLAAPGLAAADGRSIAFMPGRLQGLEGLDWMRFLSRSKPIPVLNDAHAALLGEAWKGAAAGFQNAVLLTLGTGVGGAAIVDGRLLRGHIGRAGHLGHTCLNPDGPTDIAGMPGSLEDAIGNSTLPRRSGGKYSSTRRLVEAHLAGDAEATKIWLRSVYELACAIASFINVLDPEVVILGGGISRAGRSLFEPLGRYLDSVEWRPGGHRARLLPAALGDLAGAMGAAYNAISLCQ